MRTAISALCIRVNARDEKEVLLVEKELKEKKEDGRPVTVWIFLGGKRKRGESDQACLAREGGEELPYASIEIGEPYRAFTGTTPGSKRPIRVKMYWATVTGNLAPAKEIRSAWYHSREALDANSNISEITQGILEAVRNDGHLTA